MTLSSPTRPPVTRTGRKVRKVLLVFPPQRQVTRQMKLALPPLGILYLAAVLRDRYEVEVLDCAIEGFEVERDLGHGAYVFGLPPEAIRRRIAESAPDVVGVSCIFSTSYIECQMICDLAKDVDPNAITIMGGNHPTFLDGRVLGETASVDLIVRGEGEGILPDLLDAIETDRDLRSVRGISFRDGGRVVRTPDAPLVDDLDALPYPARDLVPMEKYIETSTGHSGAAIRRRATQILTSRGCPARCTFCSSTVFWGNAYRVRSAGDVLEELEFLRSNFGIDEVQIEDDNFTILRPRIHELCGAMVERGLDMKWSLPNGVAIWTLDEKMIDVMKASGCYEVLLAFESGSQRVLWEIVKKPLKLRRVKRVVDHLKKVDIATYSSFILGFPGESMAEMRQTADLAVRLDLDMAYYFVANPLPGTVMFRQCVERGLLPEDYDFTSNNYYRGHISTDEWSAWQVERLARKAFIKFFVFKILRHPWRFTSRHRALFRRPLALIRILRGKFLDK